tara:strand:+ start:17899 stop:19512 length:1614 start_codon:yes stop_codon:yes gene_type:complete
MDSGSVFNPAFLGGNFFWWIGQIADDSYWRDNAPSGKFDDPTLICGWGARYKVRIMGLHPGSEEEMSSENLPWAQVMYPITAGGGQGGSMQCANLRNGMFVFGFFMDGNDQQVPVIMGVLSNNTQTKLLMGKQEPLTPISGFAENKVPKKGTAKETVPESAMATNSSNGATIESVVSVHQQSVADSAMQEEMEKKIPLIKQMNGSIVSSAMSAIQTVLDNLTQKIDKYLAKANSYIDAATNRIRDIRKFISNIACQIAKYMKIVFDKMMEFAMKQFNNGMTAVVAALPASFKNLIAQLKDKTTGLIECLYNKMVSCEMVQKILDGMLNVDKLEEDSDVKNRKKPKVPICVAEDLTTKIVKENSSKINGTNQNIIHAFDDFLGDVEGKLSDAKSAIGGVESSLDGITDISSTLSNIMGGMASAMNFTNISFNIFGCEFNPVPSVSDIYQFAAGGLGSGQSQMPDFAGIADSINESINNVDQNISDALDPIDRSITDALNTDIVGNFDNAVTKKITDFADNLPFAQPAHDEPDVNHTDK